LNPNIPLGLESENLNKETSELSKRIRAAHLQAKFLFVTGLGDQFPELRE
jgi:hypothetical protein